MLDSTMPQDVQEIATRMEYHKFIGIFSVGNIVVDGKVYEKCITIGDIPTGGMVKDHVTKGRYCMSTYLDTSYLRIREDIPYGLPYVVYYFTKDPPVGE